MKSTKQKQPTTTHYLTVRPDKELLHKIEVWCIQNERNKSYFFIQAAKNFILDKQYKGIVPVVMPVIDTEVVQVRPNEELSEDVKNLSVMYQCTVNQFLIESAKYYLSCIK